MSIDANWKTEKKKKKKKKKEIKHFPFKIPPKYFLCKFMNSIQMIRFHSIRQLRVQS